MDRTFSAALDVRASQHAANSLQSEQDQLLLRKLKTDNKQLGQTQELLLQEHQQLTEKLARMGETLQRMNYADAMESKLNITAQNLNRYRLLTQAKSRSSKRRSRPRLRKTVWLASRLRCGCSSKTLASKTPSLKLCKQMRSSSAPKS